MQIHVNLVLQADLPSELFSAVGRGDQDRLAAWALEEVTKLIDGECEVEFGAQVLGISLRGK